MSDSVGAVGPSTAAVETVVSQQQAASAVETREAVRSLAATLSPDAITTAHLIKGIVTAVNIHAIPRTLSAQLEGDTTTTVENISILHSYTPVVGDTVLVLKQGSTVLAMGQVSIAAVTPGQDGWIAPTLSSGVTTSGVDPVRYRVVVDNGARKIQLRGGVSLSAANPSIMWNMPADLRPVINLTPLLCARDVTNGSMAVQLIPQANGDMLLFGRNTDVASGIPSSGGGAGQNSLAFGTTGDDGLHRHYEYNAEHTPAGDGGGFTDWNGNHQHTVGAHSHGQPNHTHTTNTVDYPDTVSFNGIEYFL